MLIVNYENIYYRIINNRKINFVPGYTELHHIYPRSLGGSNNKDNLVELTAREHFICHMLLTKMYPEGSLEWIKMVKAFMNMFRWNRDNQQRYCPSRWYEYCKINFSKAQSLSQSGSGNAHYGKCWIYNVNLQQTKSIKRNELEVWMNKGWKVGRIINWNKYLNNEHYVPPKMLLKKQQTQIKKKQFKEQCKQYYEIYNKYGWEKFKEITQYPYSKANLVMAFKRNVPQFKPQNGKKRGKQ